MSIVINHGAATSICAYLYVFALVRKYIGTWIGLFVVRASRLLHVSPSWAISGVYLLVLRHAQRASGTTLPSSADPSNETGVVESTVHSPYSMRYSFITPSLRSPARRFRVWGCRTPSPPRFCLLLRPVTSFSSLFVCSASVIY